MSPNHFAHPGFPWRQVIYPALAWLLAGCSPAGNHVVQQTIEQVYPIAPDGKISIHNGDGSIAIYGSDSSEVRLEAIKKAYTKDRLAQIAINVSAQPAVLSIETNFPKKSRWSFSDRSGTVDYTLLVPPTVTIERAESSNGEIMIEGMRGANTNAKLGNGRLFIRNSFSNTNLAIGHGTLMVIYNWWEKEKFWVEGRITQGNTTLFMPGEASFHLVAEAGTGKIVSDFATHDERNDNESKKIDKVIGPAPNATLKIYAADGNIQISEENP